MSEWVLRYPDIAAAGDIRRAWQTEFDRQYPARPGLDVLPAPGEYSPRTAVVQAGDRSAHLLLNPRRREFHLGLRAGRLVCLRGVADDLATATAAARRWLAGTRPGEVAAAWPFLGSVALAEARERGDMVEAAWLWFYENPCREPVATKLHDFVTLAFHEPRLRCLRPYTSHWILRFSTTPRWPNSHDHPMVDPASAPGRFVVRTIDRRTHPESDAVAALLIVLAELP